MNMLAQYIREYTILQGLEFHQHAGFKVDAPDAEIRLTHMISLKKIEKVERACMKHPMRTRKARTPSKACDTQLVYLKQTSASGK